MKKQLLIPALVAVLISLGMDNAIYALAQGFAPARGYGAAPARLAPARLAPAPVDYAAPEPVDYAAPAPVVLTVAGAAFIRATLTAARATATPLVQAEIDAALLLLP